MSGENDAIAATGVFDHAKLAADYARYSFPKQQSRFAPAPYRAATLAFPGNTRQALRDAMADPSKVLLGVGQGIPSPFVSKLFGSAWPDFVWVDAEHCVLGRAELYDCIQAVNYFSEDHAHAFGRLDQEDRVGLMTALDAGEAAIIMPHVETADQVRHMIKNIYYPPVGERGYSPWVAVPGVSDDSLYEHDGFSVVASDKPGPGRAGREQEGHREPG